MFFRQAGINAAIFLALITVWKKRTYTSLVVLALEFLAYQKDQKKFSYLCFVVLGYIYMSTPDKVDDCETDEVVFKPYEQEIRKYLMAKDPSMLHKVISE
jgi:hypothetical protein